MGELNLMGNRLSHASMNRAAKTCARNRQTARDEAPFLLRAEMHRLLFQESKLETTREQIAKDDLEISSRQHVTDLAATELRQLRASEAGAQQQLQHEIAREEQ